MNDEVCVPGEAGCPPARPARSLPTDEGEQNEMLAGLCKALAHPARVAIVRLLLARRTCVCGEIVDALPLAQSTVSQHLAQLARAGLVRGTVAGPRVCYCVETAAIDELEALLATVAGREPDHG